MHPRVTITFDNGPTLGVTDRILRILDDAKIRSTFFIGRNLDNPDGMSLMRDAHARGHWIGNHTQTHSVALGDRPDPDYAVQEIAEAQSRIGEFSHPDKLFRPYGKSGQFGPHLFSGAAIEYLVANRFRTVLWNSLPGDWCDENGWVETGLAQISQQEWSVVVLHDFEGACLSRLPEFLQRLNDLGIECEQDFPPSVMLTRGGAALNIPADIVTR